MQKTLKQLKSLLTRRKQDEPDSKKFLCMGLTAKKNLCIHADIDNWRKTQKVQGQCKKRTAEWVRARKKTLINQEETQTQLCCFYQQYKTSNKLIENTEDHQVFTMQDLRNYGKEKMLCPYFTARQEIKNADIIVFNYLYLVDPIISENFIKDLSKDTIVVFDEAHNIDDICIEAYTVKLNKNILSTAEINIKKLEEKLRNVVDTRVHTYEAQAFNLIKKLKQKNESINIQTSDVSGKDVIPEGIMNSQLYMSSLRIIIQFLRNKLKQKIVRYYDNPEFRKQFQLNTNLESSFFKLVNSKLQQTLMMLEIQQVEELKPLKTITFFCELIFIHTRGFKIVFQPNPMDGNIAQPLLTLACLDSSLSMQPIWKSFPSVILTSGTISPIDLYPRILNFRPVVLKSINIQLQRNPINPMILGTTWNQQNLSSQYKTRSDKNVSRSYGDFLIAMTSIVPDGILCFFPSYMYMEHILKDWYELGIIPEILQNRYIFIEKKEAHETQENIKSYRKACDIGRGAIFFAIARGKIAEGVDFQQHYGRCVIMMGFPVQNSLDPVLLERIRFMVQNKQLKDKNEFFQFDTMRQCAQCLGRVMRRKTDYGLMVLADSRFRKTSRYEKLPQWILKCLHTQNLDVTFEMAFHQSSEFFRKMGQDFELVYYFLLQSQRHYKTMDFFKKIQEKQIGEDN